MHAKLTLVFLLVGYHHMCLAYMKKFAADANTKSDKFSVSSMKSLFSCWSPLLFW